MSVHEWKCHICGKVLKSLYKKALMSQIMNHKLMHELKGEWREKGE